MGDWQAAFSLAAPLPTCSVVGGLLPPAASNSRNPPGRLVLDVHLLLIERALTAWRGDMRQERLQCSACCRSATAAALAVNDIKLVVHFGCRQRIG